MEALKTHTQEELNKILENHKKWLENNNQGKRANLYRADLSRADLRGAYLNEADLYEAELREAYLVGVDLSRAKNVPFIPMACPDEGEFIGWKKAYVENHQALVKLKILEDSKRSSATGRKCRTDKAFVLSIIDLKEDKECSKAFSNYDNDFKYTVGEIVSVPDFDDDRFNECAPGIHFFINKEEALNY